MKTRVSTIAMLFACGLSMLAGVGCAKHDDHRDAHVEVERAAVTVQPNGQHALHDATITADRAIHQATNSANTEAAILHNEIQRADRDSGVIVVNHEVEHTETPVQAVRELKHDTVDAAGAETESLVKKLLK